jgi:FkbM family methyltransferase
MIKQLLHKAIFNYKKPFYISWLYDFACNYVDFYRGENNADINTNGELKFINNLFRVRHPKVVFDVGADLGQHTQKILQIDDKTEVHCFEPTKSIYLKLKRKFQSENVYINNIALSDKNGKRTFYENAVGHSFNSFYKIAVDKKPKLKAESISTATLDDYCKRKKIGHIDFVKIDTEGAELLVLAGAKKMLSKRAIDIIQFEFGYSAIFARNFLKDCFDFFDQFGYEIYKIKPLKVERIKYDVSLERCSYANFLAVRKGIDKL